MPVSRRGQGRGACRAYLGSARRRRGQVRPRRLGHGWMRPGTRCGAVAVARKDCRPGGSHGRDRRAGCGNEVDSDEAVRGGRKAA